jgi:hypothetical protein
LRRIRDEIWDKFQIYTKFNLKFQFYPSWLPGLFCKKKKILDTIGFGGRFFLKQPTLPPSLLAAGVGLA